MAESELVKYAATRPFLYISNVPTMPATSPFKHSISDGQYVQFVSLAQRHHALGLFEAGLRCYTTLGE